MLPPALEWTATVSFSLYGVLLARQAKMDLIGTFAASFLTAVGGGTLRDILLERRVFWLDDPAFVGVALALAATGILLPRAIAWLSRYLDYPDALGLGLFAILGAQISSESGCPWLVSMIFGVLTGCCGGMLADIVCGQIPRIFRPSPLYATVAFLTAGLYLLMEFFTEGQLLAATVSVTFAILLRLIALKHNLVLPNFADPETTQS